MHIPDLSILYRTSIRTLSNQVSYSRAKILTGLPASTDMMQTSMLVGGQGTLKALKSEAAIEAISRILIVYFFSAMLNLYTKNSTI